MSSLLPIFLVHPSHVLVNPIETLVREGLAYQVTSGEVVYLGDSLDGEGFLVLSSLVPNKGNARIEDASVSLREL